MGHIDQIVEIVSNHGGPMAVSEIAALLPGTPDTALVLRSLHGHRAVVGPPRLVACVDTDRWGLPEHVDNVAPPPTHRTYQERERLVADVLEEAGSALHYREICDRLLEADRWDTTAADPHAMLGAFVARAVRKGDRIVRVATGVYDLASRASAEAPSENARRQRVQARLRSERTRPQDPARFATRTHLAALWPLRQTALDREVVRALEGIGVRTVVELVALPEAGAREAVDLSGTAIQKLERWLDGNDLHFGRPFSAYVRGLRERVGRRLGDRPLPKSHLAEVLDISPSSVSKIERSGTFRPADGMLERFAFLDPAIRLDHLQQIRDRQFGTEAEHLQRIQALKDEGHAYPVAAAAARASAAEPDVVHRLALEVSEAPPPPFPESALHDIRAPSAEPPTRRASVSPPPDSPHALSPEAVRAEMLHLLRDATSAKPAQMIELVERVETLVANIFDRNV